MGYFIYICHQKIGEDKMFLRWPWRRPPLSKTSKKKSAFRMPETIWMGDVKKSAELGAWLCRRNHLRGVATFSGKRAFVD